MHTRRLAYNRALMLNTEFAVGSFDGRLNLPYRVKYQAPWLRSHHAIRVTILDGAFAMMANLRGLTLKEGGRTDGHAI